MVGRKLGRGLDFLLSRDRAPAASRAETELAKNTVTATLTSPKTREADGGQRSGFIELAPEALSPNPYQPRKSMDAAGIEKLAASIRVSGILQPLLARRKGDGFELIAGERRLRAAKLAGLKKLPVLLRETSEEEMQLLALVENVQRRDLNPIEKATSFVAIRKASGWTQKELASRVGLERSSLANYIRLLELPPEIQEALKEQKLSMGHARALLAADPAARNSLARKVIAKGLSVRETERLGKEGFQGEQRTSKRSPTKKRAAWMEEMEGNLLSALGCKVAVSYRLGRGRIQLEIGSRTEFDRVYELLMNALPQSTEDELIAAKLGKKT